MRAKITNPNLQIFKVVRIYVLNPVQGRLIIKLTIKFYSILKKVMVQGTTESLYEWISDIYEIELAGSLKSTKQESQVPLHSDNYEISILSEEVQNQALSTPSK